MSKHNIEKKAPESWRTPESIPPVRAQVAATAAQSSIMT